MALYHRYRSQQLGELAGQSHIVQLLRNAISNGRIGHAYLFSGPRGTGKTSTARILATSLNCERGPTVTPCGACHNCVAITQGHSSDVVEMDAASHTGVDHIRGIIEQVVFQPIECRYRMYIIDEVHMLSGGAFNALLKTLEEPPAHVMFILATTEPHKVPATIHSRCQHLQFRRLTQEELVGQLSHIATQESLGVAEGVLDMVARRAGGSMRDAISVLEQLVAYSGGHIALEDVRGVLGVSDPAVLKSLTTAILSGDVRLVLSQLREAELSGIHPVQLVDDMIQTLTETLVAGCGSGSVVWPEGASMQAVTSLLDGLSQLLMDFRQYPDPFTVCRIRLLSWMVNRSGVTGVSSVVEAVGGVVGGVGVGVPSTGVGVEGKGKAGSDGVVAHDTGGHDTGGQAAALAAIKARRAGESSVVEPVVEPVGGVGVGVPSMGVGVEGTGKAGSDGVVAHDTGGHDTGGQAAALAAIKARRAGESSVVEAVGGVVGGIDQVVLDSTKGNGVDQWPLVLQLVQGSSQPLYSILIGSKVGEDGGGDLAIHLRQTFSFFIEKINEPANHQLLSTAIQSVYGMARRFYIAGDSKVGAEGVTEREASGMGRHHKLNDIIALFDGVKLDSP